MWGKAIATGLVSLAFATTPVGGQPAPATPTATPSATKLCDPVAPESGPDGEPIYTGCQIKVIGGTPPKLVSAPEEPDLSKLYEQGIQGQIFFDIIIGKDGIPHTVTVRASSRSPELDAVGLEIVQHSIFSPATDHEGKPIEARAVYPTYFWKDSLLDGTIFSKRCREFVVDADWHAKTFPEEQPDKYRGWLLARGAIVSKLYSQGKANELDKFPSYSEVMETCRKSPSKRFFDVAIGK